MDCHENSANFLAMTKYKWHAINKAGNDNRLVVIARSEAPKQSIIFYENKNKILR